MLDTFTETVIAPLRTTTGDIFFSGVTEIGGVAFAILVASLLISIAYACKKCRANAQTILIAIIGASATVEIVRMLVHRIRPVPIEIAIGMETSWSFPSGHSAFAVACFGAIAVVFLRQTKVSKMRMLVGAAAGLIIATVLFSRLYLRVHYATDVLCGALIGFVWIHIALYSVKMIKKKYAAF